MDAPPISPKLSIALEAFRADGISPTDEEIIWLASLRHKCDRMTDGSVPWMIGAPLSFCGIDFYSLHRLAESWWLRCFHLLDGNPRDQVLVYIFAHVHSKPGDITLRGLMNVDIIRDVINDWANDQAMHDEQIDKLCERLSEMDGNAESIPDPDDAYDKSVDSDGYQDHSISFVSIMCKAFPGISPEFWLSEITVKDARKMLADGCSENFADSEERTEAIRNFLKAVKWVWHNHQVEIEECLK